MDNNNSDKKAKGTKKCVIKRIFKFNDYKNCLLNNEIITTKIITINHTKHLKLELMMYILKKSIRLH